MSEDYTIHDLFRDTDEVLARATPLPWVWGQHSEPDAGVLAAWAATCVSKRDGATMQMAVVMDAELGPEAYLQTAMCGNGPRSEANAQLVIAAVNNYPVLREAVRDRDAELACLRAQLAERDATLAMMREGPKLLLAERDAAMAKAERLTEELSEARARAGALERLIAHAYDLDVDEVHGWSVEEIAVTVPAKEEPDTLYGVLADLTDPAKEE